MINKKYYFLLLAPVLFFNFQSLFADDCEQQVNLSLSKEFKWPEYMKLSFFEDYTPLKNLESIPYRDALDRLKYIPLSEDGNIWMNFGGKARIRFEDYHNYNFGIINKTNDDSYLLQRYFLYSNIYIGSHLRFYVEGRSAFANDRDLPGGRSDTLHDELDLINGFIDITLPISSSIDAKIRAGRFEFYYGKGRMLACRNWSQLRRPYDGYKLKLSHDKWWIEGFWVQGTENRKNKFNRLNDDLTIFGVYSHFSKKIGMPFNLDLYVVGKDRYIDSQNDDQRMNFGARIFGKIKGTALSYDIEASKQVDYGSSPDISAATFSAELTYKWQEVSAKPWITAGFDWASGDSDPANGTINTFEPVSPFGHFYFGYVDVVGRQNIISPWLRVGCKPTKKLMLKAEGHWFYADEPADKLHNACNCSQAIRNGNKDASDYIGFELDLVIKYKFNHHLDALIGYSYLWAGDFIDDTVGGNEDIQRWMIQIQYEF